MTSHSDQAASRSVAIAPAQGLRSVETEMLRALDLPSEWGKVVETKPVTRPVMQQVDNQPFAVRIDGMIHKGDKIEPTEDDAADAPTEPPHLMFVTDLQTGAEMTLIANATMKSALERMYPDGGYVGRFFAMLGQLRPHKKTRMMREYLIREIVFDPTSAKPSTARKVDTRKRDQHGDTEPPMPEDDRNPALREA